MLNPKNEEKFHFKKPTNNKKKERARDMYGNKAKPMKEKAKNKKSNYLHYLHTLYLKIVSLKAWAREEHITGQ